MMSARKKRIRIIGLSLIAAMLLLLALRGIVLGRVIKAVDDRLNKDFGLALTTEDCGFSGFSTVWIKGLKLLPTEGDTLLRIDTLSLRPDWLSIFNVRPGIGYLFIHNGSLNLNASSFGNNTSFLHRKNISEKRTTPSADRDYARLAEKVVSQAFSLAPQEADIRTFSLKLSTDTFKANVRILDFRSDKDSVIGIFDEPLAGRKWHIEGSFNQHKRSFSIQVHPTQGDGRLPLIGRLLGGTVGYDTLKVSLSESDFSNGQLKIKGAMAFSGLMVHHPRIASDSILIKSTSFDYSIVLGKQYVELDSSSVARLDRMIMHPFLRMERTDSKSYKAMLEIERMPADDFFSSLPSGMFGDVRSLRADGSLAFRMDFALDERRLDQVLFHCTMKKEGFRIRDFGSSALLRLNGEFIHEVYEKDRFVRAFPVGPSYPSYTPLAEVSGYFRNAVLTSEDGNFYFHNGFNEDAFRKSIADNYRAGKFVRGGSTITMQLVKNVFLTRKKTVARKVEEALMVWLIESGRLVSKDRMLEVYFNIIELGPGVYGIGEASKFYFDKRPKDLRLSESIFLANLLPRPKAFRYCFDSTAHLKPYMADYYRVMTNFMVKKNLITAEEGSSLVPDVELKGPAAALLFPSDSLTRPR
ncbi:MAG: biosynthetic peptidoglycan transglycosylase [Bacteroidota bacterium]